MEMVQDFKKVGEEHYAGALKDGFNFSKYISILENHEKGIGLKAGYVPCSTFWLVENDQILGVSRLRHSITPELKKVGGHIGYNVPPSKRNKGNATKLLELTLKEAQKRGIKEALVTCKSWNDASAKVIKKNGGIFQKKVKLNDGQEEHLYIINNE